jgi:hypothetical protein
MAAVTWQDIIRMGTQRSVGTGRGGATGTGLNPEEIAAYRTAELEADAGTALARRAQTTSEQNIAFNQGASLRQEGIQREAIGAQKDAAMVSGVGQLGMTGLMAYSAGKTAGLWGAGATAAKTTGPALGSTYASGVGEAGITGAGQEIGSMASTAIPYVGAALAGGALYNAFGEGDKPYGEKGFAGQMTSNPLYGAPAYLSKQWLGDSNTVTKSFNRLGQRGEEILTAPLGKLVKGDVSGWFKDTLSAVADDPLSVLTGGVSDVLKSVFG